MGGAVAAITALTALAGIGMQAKQAHDQKKTAQRMAASTPVFNADAENKKAALQEAEANRKRAISQTETVKTSALGDTQNAQVKKKTLLGG